MSVPRFEPQYVTQITQLRTERPGLHFRLGRDYSLPHSVQTALMLARSLTQWIPDSLAAGVKQPARGADNSPAFVSRSRMVELYLHFPLCLHGIMLN
jgi:hypothetical protein